MKEHPEQLLVAHIRSIQQLNPFYPMAQYRPMVLAVSVIAVVTLVVLLNW